MSRPDNELPPLPDQITVAGLDTTEIDGFMGLITSTTPGGDSAPKNEA